MTLQELETFLRNLPDKVLSDSSEIVADTATEYYKETFYKKAFDGNPWAPAKVPKKTGSLLIDSGALMNSIRPAVITPQRVVISAGNEKVDYARAHNEGFVGVAHGRHIPEKPRKKRCLSKRIPAMPVYPGANSWETQRN